MGLRLWGAVLCWPALLLLQGSARATDVEELLAGAASNASLTEGLQLARAQLALPGAAQLRLDAGGLAPAGLRAGAELELCDCEKATSSPDGLSCGKEGWFISSFEREGSWLSGGGYVPLSHAICCRPCLPQTLPDSGGALPPGASAVAVISVGCHGSSAQGAAALRCEAAGNSFVSGWQQALRVSAAVDAYYPIGAAACCTPALLLASGDAWELERCGCTDAPDINCGGTATHQLLFGYSNFRLTTTGEYVPVGPAACCRACLSPRVAPLDACADLNYCSGHGVCALGACECRSGYSGADCSHEGGAGGLPWWAVTLIVLGACAVFAASVVGANLIVRTYQRRILGLGPRSDSGEPLLAPLLLRIDGDDAGSVGSEDTSAVESEAEPGMRTSAAAAAQRQPLAVPLAPLATGAPGAEEPESADAHSEIQAAPAQQREQGVDRAADGRRRRRWRRRRAEVAERDAPTPEAPATERAEHSGTADPNTDWEREPREEDKEGAAEAGGEGSGGSTPGGGSPCGKAGLHLRPLGGLVGVDCSVCMARPVQVALIPCGHASICRRCSRRLARCPICRKEIARRQRLFVGG
ncbi:hypothetical protein WJX81_004918 [Elliptochloris bilobata]|uniref:RING-type domain-containing protein n=1 Tax=Elliptochloris bilobata TaxID=381761 RepID=A0AAW1SJM3_9CHLO